MRRYLRLYQFIGSVRLVQAVELFKCGGIVVQYAGMTRRELQRLGVLLQCSFVAALSQELIAALDKLFNSLHRNRYGNDGES